jgi:hypothetical protein
VSFLSNFISSFFNTQTKIGFDVNNISPLSRTFLIRTSPTTHIVLSVSHHLVVDGWCAQIALRDFASAFKQGNYLHQLFLVAKAHKERISRKNFPFHACNFFSLYSPNNYFCFWTVRLWKKKAKSRITHELPKVAQRYPNMVKYCA